MKMSFLFSCIKYFRRCKREIDRQRGYVELRVCKNINKNQNYLGKNGGLSCQYSSNIIGAARIFLKGA